jgi:hypothetical protein
VAPSYSEGRDQEDLSLKPAQTKSERPYLKEPIAKKKGLVKWLNVQALRSNPSTGKKKRKPSGGHGRKKLQKYLLIKYLLCTRHLSDTAE